MHRTSSAKVASAGVTRTRLAVEDELGWIFREQPTEDYGIDAYTEVVDGENVHGRLLALQIKSGRSWFGEEGAAGWWFRPAPEHPQYWLSHSLPVAVVLYHPDSKRCHWQLVNRETLVETSTGGMKLLVPEAQTLDASARVPLRKAAEGDRYASPVHVAAADALLDAEPLAPTQSFRELDQTAAAVAAAHWLLAATDVMAEMVDCTPTEVVLEADDIQALPVDTLTFVLERLDDDRSLREVVLDLVNRDYEGDQDVYTSYGTRADARRPAHDLLDDLLDGIQGCYALFSAHIEFDDVDLDGDDFDEDEYERRIEQEFCEAVRRDARSARKRLL